MLAWYVGNLVLKGSIKDLLDFCLDFSGTDEDSYRMNNILKADNPKDRLEKWGIAIDFDNKISEVIEDGIVEFLDDIETFEYDENEIEHILFTLECPEKLPVSFFEYVSKKYSLKVIASGTSYMQENYKEVYDCYVIENNKTNLTHMIGFEQSEEFLDNII